ncbi:MAG: hypothetical protein Q9187_001462 [Circinaria calcarea]
MTESIECPLSGLWKPTHLQRLYYGPSSVQQHLKSCLPSSNSKAFIITGSSLATKTPFIKQIEELLTEEHCAGTFSDIKQHAPVAQLDQATDAVGKDSSIDTIISKTGKFLYHIAIPTTLGAAECTFIAGYTRGDGVKVGVADPELAPHVIIYDSKFAVETPRRLWLSTGIRSLDHAIELLYHPTATEVPAKQLVLTAIGGLFKYLPKSKAEPNNEEYITRLQLASFSSLFPLGTNVKGGLGLSHTLGYALGSPYSIPHGITSCLTLGKVVKLKAEKPEEAEQIARALPFIGQASSGDTKQDAIKVGDAIEELVRSLGLESSLKQYGVGKDQAPNITKMAAGGQEEGPMYDQVLAIVNNLGF